MKMIQSFLVLILLTLSATLFATPVQNVSDTCTCFTVSSVPIPRYISHCDKVATPRIVGLFADPNGDTTVNILPGITYDAPVFNNYQNNPGVKATGFRSPGPADYNLDTSLYITQDEFPSLYAVPIFLNAGSGEISSGAIVMLSKDNFDVNTCTYKPSDSQHDSHVIRLSH